MSTESIVPDAPVFNVGSDGLFGNLLDQAISEVNDPTPSPQSIPTPEPTSAPNPEPTPENPENPEPTPENPENPENTEEQEKKPKEQEKKPEDGDDDEVPSDVRQSAKAGKRFAEMRVELREKSKEIAKLQQEVEALKSKAPEASETLEAELSQYKDIVSAYAYQTSEEYKSAVAQPFNKANSAISSLAPTVTQEQLNEVALNAELDDFDREGKYEDLAKEAGLDANEMYKFVRLSMARDKAIAKATEFKENADKFREEFLKKLGGGKYEVDLTNYTSENFKAEADSLGLDLDDKGLEEVLKQGRHFAHKIDNASFMKAALLPKVVDALEDARQQIKELEEKVAKLRSSAPSATKGTGKAPQSQAPAPTKQKDDGRPRETSDLFAEAMKLAGF